MSSRSAWIAASLRACAMSLAACTTGGVDVLPDAPRDAGALDARVPVCARGGPDLVCDGEEEVRCGPEDEFTRPELSRRDCMALGEVCTHLGCARCRPRELRCGDIASIEVCSDDGSVWEPFASCDTERGNVCDPLASACVNLCAAARTNQSYVGCEYWPTTTLNTQLAEEFEFAVSVANPAQIPAHVEIERGGRTLYREIVDAGGIATIRLPYVRALSHEPTNESVLVRDGAYRLLSNVPVTVYQFNPLEFEFAGRCVGEPGGCNSFTNDASLLLPTDALTPNYTVLSYPTTSFVIGTQQDSIPGFFAVVAVEEGDTTVAIEFRGHSRASADGTIAAHRPGESAEFTLHRGDVLQIVSDRPEGCTPGGTTSADGVVYTHCVVTPEHDLTGSRIRADRKVAVFGGHDCAFAPFDVFACDHLEESVTPEETWGTDVVISHTASQGVGDPNLVRLVSSRDGNVLTFDPAIRAPITLARGEVFEVQIQSDLRVTGTEAFAAVQYLVGQDLTGASIGDPAMLIAIPTEQFRTEYTVLTPATYTSNYINVVATANDVILLDGTPIDEAMFTPLGSDEIRVARVPVAAGSHRFGSESPFGVVAYGFAAYTSYMYAGGLDLRPINLL